MFKEFGMIFLIIIIHELGHLFISYCFKWNLDKITIYPFGGCVKFDEKVNRPIKEELLILIGGPLFQIMFFFVIYVLFIKGFITYRSFLLFRTYHYTLLIFNLLPVYPLDGGRIINLVFNFLFPFRKGNKIEIIISFISIFLLIFFYRSLNYTLMCVLLLIELIFYYKNQDYLYNKMLLERYMNRYKYNKFKIIKDKNLMYKDRRHIILYDNKYITEKNYLNERFKVIK